MASKKPPKKKRDDPGQSERFVKKARELADAGELNLTEAEETFERVIRKVVRSRPSSE